MKLAELVIIADDLTGALDAAAPFCSANRTVRVATQIDALPEALSSSADVVAVSTRSRELNSKLGYERTRAAVELATGARLFLKIDSRLKGNLSANIRALSSNRLVVAPAIPAFGRTVRDGLLSGFGIDTPIDIATRLGQFSNDAAIPDSLSDEHLDAIVHQYKEYSLIGARGLASALARADFPNSDPYHPLPLAGRTGAAIGSTDPITLVQIEQLDSGEVDVLMAPAGRYTNEYHGTKNLLLQATGAKQQSQSAVSHALAESFKPLASLCNNLIVSGGATAETVLDALKISILTLEGELLPGIPVCSASGWRIVTKSGGFGTPSTLQQLMQTNWNSN